jgi:hypothetical protein
VVCEDKKFDEGCHDGLKLEGPNQVIPILKTNDFMGFMDGSEPCPPKYVLDAQGQVTATLGLNFLLWTKKDQFVLSWLNATLSEKVMSTTFGATSAKEVWDSLSSRLLLIRRPGSLIFSANFKVCIKVPSLARITLKLPSNFLPNWLLLDNQ